MKPISNKLTHLRKAGLLLSLALILVAMLGLFSRGLNLGIDFTGGFITEFATSEIVEKQLITQFLTDSIDGKFALTGSNDGTTWVVRQPDTGSGLTVQSWVEVLSLQLSELAEPVQLEVLDSDYIGKQIGQELKEQGGLAMLTALIIIMLYLSARFEWRFALGAIMALFHDVILVLGLFAWTQLEFNLTILAGLLAIIGYSLNDSIVVADRIRELMQSTRQKSLAQVINSAITDTITRTLITSGTTLTTIACIWWLAGTPLFGFSVALFSGIVVGTLSSICISATFPELARLDVELYTKKKANEEALDNLP